MSGNECNQPTSRKRTSKNCSECNSVLGPQNKSSNIFIYKRQERERMKLFLKYFKFLHHTIIGERIKKKLYFSDKLLCDKNKEQLINTGKVIRGSLVIFYDS